MPKIQWGGGITELSDKEITSEPTVAPTVTPTVAPTVVPSIAPTAMPKARGNQGIAPASVDTGRTEQPVVEPEVTTLTANIPIDESIFPDPNFRAYIETQFDWGEEPGYLTSEEIMYASSIYLSNSEITSLEGIGVFTNLSSLACSSNNITELDVSENQELTYLDCYENQLSSLNLSANTKLEQLYCGGNQLTSLDISNNALLGYLSCNINQLTTIDASSSQNLWYINISDNQVTSLEISAGDALQCVYALNNKLAELPNLTTATNLATDGVDFSYNQLAPEEFDNNLPSHILSETVWLQEQKSSQYFGDDVVINTSSFPDRNFRDYVSENIDTNSDGTLDIFEQKAVERIDVAHYYYYDEEEDGKIATLEGIEFFTNLQYLNCYNNKLTDLDVSSNTQLIELLCSENLLENISVSNNYNLSTLTCDKNNLTSLNVSANSKLSSLYCRDNQLTTLDLSHNPQMYSLNCSNNLIETLATPSVNYIGEWNCSNNNLSILPNMSVIEYADSWNVDFKGNYIQDSEFMNKLPQVLLDEDEWLQEQKNGQYIGASVAINKANFPDDSFRQYVYENLNENGDNELDAKEQKQVTEIQISDFGYNEEEGIDNRITSLKGIEFFPNLEGLYAGYNNLGDLDLSNNLELRTLYCYNSELTSLNVSNNSKLQSLACSYNQLTTLDVSNNSQLRSVDASYNRIATFTMGDSVDYYRVDLAHNQLVTLPDLRALGDGVAAYDIDFRANIIPEEEFDGDKLPTDLLANADWLREQIDGQYIGDSVEINDETFPDDNFRDFVEEELDINKDKNLDIVEIKSVENMYIYDREYYEDEEEVYDKRIENLKGIEIFVNLKELHCNGNKIEELDLSSNLKLEYLDCSSNQLSTLDISANQKLRQLHCDNNQLTILNVSANPNLTRLYCRRNQIETLIVNETGELEALDCRNNKLTELPDLRALDDLSAWDSMGERYSTDFRSNYIEPEEFDDKLPQQLLDEAEWLQEQKDGQYLGGEEVTIEINTTTFPDEFFRAYVKKEFDINNDGKLDIAEQKDVEDIYIDDQEYYDDEDDGFRDERIATLEGIAVFTNLERLYCGNNKLEELDLSANLQLRELYCGSNNLESIDVSANSKLEALNCNRNQLSTLDVANNPQLRNLSCSNNQLTELDLRNNNQLSNVVCNNNQITTFQLGQMSNIHQWECEDNQLSTLPDLSTAENLDASWASLIGNYIPEGEFVESKLPARLWNDKVWLQEQIDGQYFGDNVNINATFTDEKFRDYVDNEFNLNGNTVLEPSEYKSVNEISIRYEEIESLKGIEVFTNLIDLSCEYSMITSLDLSKNKKLEYVSLSHNQLTKVDIGDNTNIYALRLDNNKLTTLPNLRALTSLNSWSTNFIGNTIPASEFYNKLPEHLLAEENAEWLQEQIDGQYFGTAVAINSTNFPDAKFRQYVSDIYDIDEDGKLDAYEQKSVQSLYLYDESIKNLKGMEVFTNLRWFACVYAGITSLDIRGNEKLESVDCRYTQLTEFIVGNNVLLEELYLNNNKLKVLPNLAVMTELSSWGTDFKGNIIPEAELRAKLPAHLLTENEWLQEQIDGQYIGDPIAISTAIFPDDNFRTYIREELDENGNGSLEATEYKSVEWLSLWRENIADLTGIEVFTNLTSLSCSNNKLTSLDISNNNKLERLYCDNNRLTQLDVSGNDLRELSCIGNGLTDLTLGNYEGLEELYVSNNVLTELPDMSALEDLYAGNADFRWNYLSETELRTKLPAHLVSNNSWLEEQISDQNTDEGVTVDSSNFPDDKFRAYVLAEFDRDGNGKLNTGEIINVENLSVMNKGIADLTGVGLFTNLRELDCTGNELTTLDVSGNELLRWVYANYNQIVTLNVSNNPSLEDLNCTHNKLGDLDLSGAPNLQYVDCSNNELTDIDVSNNAELYALNLSANKFTTLPDMTGLTNLEFWGTSFIANDIVASEFTNKLPAQMLEDEAWLEGQVEGQCIGVVEVSINAATFPDEKFRDYVAEYIDLDGDMKLSPVEQKCVTEIDVHELGIKNLQGIEKFTSLLILACGNNELVALDLSANKQLEGIYCSNNKLTTLNISNSQRLSELYCTDNELKSIIAGNHRYLYCFKAGNNKLTTLPDLKNTALVSYYTDFIGNALTEAELRAKLPTDLLADAEWLREQLDGQKASATPTPTPTPKPPTPTPTQKPPAHIHVYNKEVIVKLATCGAVGTKRMDCACGAHGATSVIPATGKHSFGAYVTTATPTAVATGTKARTCKTCGSKETAVIPKLKAFVKLNFSGTLPLKVKQATKAVKVTMEKGDKIVSWKTSNKKIATVSGSGKITGKKVGTAKITVKLQSGISKTFKVKVTKAAVATKSIKLDKKKVTLAKGKSVKLVASLLPITTKDKVKFTTSNSKVATVSSKGIIKAKKKGTATITVYAGKKKATFKVTVK